MKQIFLDEKLPDPPTRISVDGHVIKFEKKNSTITITKKGWSHERYYINLDYYNDSAKILNILMQIEEKSWMTDGIFRAIFSVFRGACWQTFNDERAYCASEKHRVVEWKG